VSVMLSEAVMEDVRRAEPVTLGEQHTQAVFLDSHRTGCTYAGRFEMCLRSTIRTPIYIYSRMMENNLPGSLPPEKKQAAH